MTVQHQDNPHAPQTRTPGLRGELIRMTKALGVSLEGLRMATISERAFQSELMCCIVLAPVAILMDVTPIEHALLLGTLLLVLIVELLNTAIEAVVDLVSPEYDMLAGKAKDCGSAAVLLALVLTAVVWGIILL